MTCWGKCKSCKHPAEAHIEGSNGDRCDDCESGGKVCPEFTLYASAGRPTLSERAAIRAAGGDKKEALRRIGSLRSTRPGALHKASARRPRAGW